MIEVRECEPDKQNGIFARGYRLNLGEVFRYPSETTSPTEIEAKIPKLARGLLRPSYGIGALVWAFGGVFALILIACSVGPVFENSGDIQAPQDRVAITLETSTNRHDWSATTNGNFDLRGETRFFRIRIDAKNSSGS
jgi:hypothetical protein